MLAINDVEQFWQQTYNNFLKGTFTPIHQLISYDSNDPGSPSICDRGTYHLVNAFYCTELVTRPLPRPGVTRRLRLVDTVVSDYSLTAWPICWS